MPDGRTTSAHSRAAWWERSKGPVPAGMRVVHEDGDSLNDAPTNLVLAKPADVAFLWHERNPEGSRINFEKMRAGAGRPNSERAAVHRAYNWLPTRWYPVDFAAGAVYNLPRRQRWEVFADFGVAANASNWRTCLSAALGWSGLTFTAAALLQAMASAGGVGLTRWELCDRLDAARRLYGIDRPRLSRGAFYSELSGLAGQVRTARRGRLSANYYITSEALANRTTPCPVVPIRGSELKGEPFIRFRKLHREAPNCLPAK